MLFQIKYGIVKLLLIMLRRFAVMQKPAVYAPVRAEAVLPSETAVRRVQAKFHPLLITQSVEKFSRHADRLGRERHIRFVEIGDHFTDHVTVAGIL